MTDPITQTLSPQDAVNAALTAIPTTETPPTPLTTPPPPPPAPAVNKPTPPPSSSVAMGDDTPLAFVGAPPSVTTTTTTTIPLSPPPAPEIITEPKKQGGKAKVMAAVLGVFLLIAGIAGGFYFYTNYLPPRPSEIASIQSQYPSPKDCNGACFDGRLLKWDYRQDKCIDSGKACVVTEQHSKEVECGTTGSVPCDACGGFCILPIDKTCNQMGVEKCGESPVFGASCSEAKLPGYNKTCTCDGTGPYYFDADGVCDQAEANRLGLKDQNYNEVGLCALAKNGCNDGPPLPGVNPPPTVSCDFTCSSSGCQCTSTRNECIVYHWKCNRIDNLGGGCQDGTPKTGQSANFSASCGSEQIDVMCHGTSVAFRSRVNTAVCGATPSRPPRSPLPSAAIEYSMSCTGLTKNVVAPIVGSKITFTCAGATVPPAGATLLKYNFRYSLDSGAWKNLTNKTNSTAELTIAACGSYSVQCRACVTYGGQTQCDPIWQGATQ